MPRDPSQQDGLFHHTVLDRGIGERLAADIGWQQTLQGWMVRLAERVLVPDLRERAKEPPSTRSSKPSTTRNACSNAPPCSDATSESTNWSGNSNELR